MHRSTPWWLATVAILVVVAAACTSGSGTASSAIASSSQASGSAVSSAAVGANMFSCPPVSEINSLTAMAFVAAAGNGSDHCEYVVTTGSTEAARVTIDHPPASATRTDQTLSQFRAAIVAAGDVVLTTAPQYSADSFIAQFGKVSCSVFALARDGRVMQVQATHRSPATVNDCSLAQSVTALTGTASQPASAPAGSETAGSETAGSETSGSETSGSSQVQASTSEAGSTSAPISSAPASPTSGPRPSPTTPSFPNPFTTSARPSTPTPSEVLIFSTGPAVSLTLPTARPTTR